MMNNLLRDEYSYSNDMAYDDVDNDELMFHVEESTSAAADDVVSMASVLTDGATMNNETSVLEQFSHWYQGVHGYVCVVCCMFGIVSNAMNILVLTRRSMTSPTNHLLTAVAIADLLTMVSYLPYAVYFYCITVPDEMYGHPIGWVIYLMFNTYFTITTHTAAMWLTVALAVFRYLVVCCKQSVGANLCSLRRAKITIAAVFVATPIFCIPHYVKYVIVSRTPTNTSTQYNSDVNLVTDGDLERANVDHYVSISPPSVQVDMGYWFVDAKIYNETMTTVNYWLFGVVLKVVPCVLLAVLSWLLVRAMREAADKRRRLLSAGRRDESERAGEHVRTTAMLVAVVLCFLATELPQGVLALLSSVVPGVFENVYVPLADIFDVLVLVNSAVNFVLYCSMSRQFRRTFGELFIDSTCVGRKKKALNSQAAITSSGLTRATTLTAKDEGTPIRR